MGSEGHRTRRCPYKLTIALIRAYTGIADEMKEAGYTEGIEEIKVGIRRFENVRKEIQLASGDYIDLKQYEPAMRHLLAATLVQGKPNACQL